MKPEQRIQEAHGLWELRIVRLAALVEAKAKPKLIEQALREEQTAFINWQSVSREVGA